MTVKEYQNKALEYMPPTPWHHRLEYGLIGLAGESGEAIDIYKKFKFQGHALDDKHIVRELGDVLWYLNCAATALGYSLEDLMAVNIEKLEKRYPDGYFDPARSINRAEDDT